MRFQRLKPSPLKYSSTSILSLSSAMLVAERGATARRAAAPVRRAPAALSECAGALWKALAPATRSMAESICCIEIRRNMV